MIVKTNKLNKHIIIIVYNLIKKIKIPISITNNHYLDKNTNCIYLKSNQCKHNLNLFLSKVNKIVELFDSVFLNKIKFKGKGFRVRFKKKLKILKFTFGHSHINYLFINEKKIKIKRLGKYKYTFKSKQILKMNNLLRNICLIKPINMYTKRGIRLGRQIIYKRKGKKSTYI